MGGESRRDAAAPVVLAPEMVDFMAVFMDENKPFFSATCGASSGSVSKCTRVVVSVNVLVYLCICVSKCTRVLVSCIF